MCASACYPPVERVIWVEVLVEQVGLVVVGWASPAHVGSRVLASSGEQQSVDTPQAARGWTRPPCRQFKIQSCVYLGSAFEVGLRSWLRVLWDGAWLNRVGGAGCEQCATLYSATYSRAPL